MSIDFTPDRWEKIAYNARQWWAGKLGRPLIQVRLKGKDPQQEEPALPYHEFTSFYEADVPADKIAERWDYELCCTEHMGDGFPHIWPNFGPGVIAAFIGAHLRNGEKTSWFFPEEILDIERLHFQFSAASPWFRRVCDLIQAAQLRMQGQVQIAMTDLGGNLDILSAFRSPEGLLFDLSDHPDQVKRLTWEAHHVWWDYFKHFCRLMAPLNPGYTCWTPLFSQLSSYMLQCDFSYMISPKMFAEFVLPELAASANRLGNAFYHLDGAGQLPHLDLLLGVDALKGVQWIPGDGAADVSHWPEVYRRIYKAGKLTQVFSNQYQGGFDLLDILKDQVGSVENLCFVLDADVSQKKDVARLLAKYGVE